MNKIVSFDIFDTCLVRASGTPDSVFEILARSVLPDASNVDVADFVRMRKEGELEARNKSAKEEVTIDEIYDNCDFSVFSALSNKEILDLELKIEESVLLPVHVMKNKVDRYRSKGWTICFISDIYLPEWFIKKILSKYDFFKEGDGLFLSSTYLVTKASGNLFKVFKHKYPFVNLLTWIHHGDNFFSDYVNAFKNGALPNRIVHSFNDWETIKLEPFEPEISKILCKYTSISKALRLSRKTDKHYSFAVDIIAPMYVSYVVSVLLWARKRGIKDLFFFARDGFLFYLIAKLFQSNFKEISFHYTYISRKAIYYPTLENVSCENLRKIFPTKISVENVLDTLLLSEDDLDKQTMECIYNEKDRDKVLSSLCFNTNVYSKIKERHQKQRKVLLEYFKQEGIATKKTTVAIVDLRGTRKSHEMINEFLEKNGFLPLYGFYYEVLDDRVSPKRADSYHACIFREQFQNSDLFEALQNFTPIFEQYFSATNQQRTSHYQISGSHIIPVFDNDYINPISDRLFEINKQACLDFGKYIKSMLTFDYSETISRIFLSNFLKSLGQYNKEALCFFQNFEMSENKFEKRVYLKKLSLIELKRHNHIMWFKGSVIFTFGRFPYYMLKAKKWLITKIFK